MKLTEIENAYRLLRVNLRKTPLLLSKQLCSLTKGQVYLKLENQQVSGSFKVRGALQVMASLTEEQKLQGVIAPTAGNHGMGLAYAGRAAGVPVHIYLPESTDTSKVHFMIEHDALVSYFPDIETARQAALRDSTEKELAFVSAYNNPHMITGAGTVALEILNQIPNPDMVVVCTGGGGLASGMGLYLKAKNPNIKLVAVQSENSPTFAEWFRQGNIKEVVLTPSIAEGLGGFIDPATITFPVFKKVVDEVVTVSESEIRIAMKWLLDEHNLIIEPSGAATVAALLAEKVQVKDKKVAAVITGSNISPLRFKDLLKIL